MNNISPGDWVICNDNRPSDHFSYPQGIPKAGQKYEVVKIGMGKNKDDQIYIAGFTVIKHGVEQGFGITRFERCEPPEVATPTTRSQLWARYFIKAEERGYDNKAEDLALTIINDHALHNVIKERIAAVLAGKMKTLQDFCVNLSQKIEEINSTKSLWKIFSPTKKACVIDHLLNHFLPEMTDHELTSTSLMREAFRLDPSLQNYLPIHYTGELRNTTLPYQSELPTTTIMDKYAKIAVATPTLIYGSDISEMSDESLITCTVDIQRRIDKLRAIPGNSRKVAREIKEAETAMAKVVEKLDADEPTAQ